VRGTSIEIRRRSSSCKHGEPRAPMEWPARGGRHVTSALDPRVGVAVKLTVLIMCVASALQRTIGKPDASRTLPTTGKALR